jgi:predicted Fe-Mo cluster-binding NifX family protein
MRIAVTAAGPELASPVDGRFGRARWILIHDEEAGTWDAVDNAQARDALQGAGVQAAQLLADRSVQVLLTGITGPKAFRALSAAGVRVFHGANGTAERALDAWRRGQLSEATEKDARGGR